MLRICTWLPREYSVFFGENIYGNLSVVLLFWLSEDFVLSILPSQKKQSELISTFLETYFIPKMAITFSVIFFVCGWWAGHNPILGLCPCTRVSCVFSSVDGQRRAKYGMEHKSQQMRIQDLQWENQIFFVNPPRSFLALNCGQITLHLNTLCPNNCIPEGLRVNCKKVPPPKAILHWTASGKCRNKCTPLKRWSTPCI